MLNRGLALLLIVLSISVYAEVDNTIITPPKWPELKLATEYAVDNMSDGNLSGIAMCGDDLLAISDRSDTQLYKLIEQQDNSKLNKLSVLKAEAEVFDPPSVPTNALPVWGGLANLGIGMVRGGAYDYEGVTCDIQGNRYIVSEAYLAVLKVPQQGKPEWLALPDNLWQQAKEQGLLQKINQMLEGIAISPDGQRLWLADERNKRGILAVQYDAKQGWQCPNQQCVLLVEGNKEAFPKQFRRKNRVDARDFSDLVFYKEKLFTLERGAFRVCRRNLKAEVEQCWSFAEEGLQPQRQYRAYGMPEALWVDDTGAWIGLDNDNANKRIDGESRPIVWRFEAPKKGWLATEGTLND